MKKISVDTAIEIKNGDSVPTFDEFLEAHLVLIRTKFLKIIWYRGLKLLGEHEARLIEQEKVEAA